MHEVFGMSEMEQRRQQQHPVFDGICTAFFPAGGGDMAQQQYLRFHDLQSQINIQEERNEDPPPPPHHPRFPPLFQHQTPITQHLFQQSHQFHLFHQQQQRRLPYRHPHLQHDLGQSDTSSSPPTIPAFLLPSINFSLSVNENSSSAGGADDILHHNDEVDGSEGRCPPPPHYQTSRARRIGGDDTIVVKEKFWTPLNLDLDYKEKNEEYRFKHFKEIKKPTTVDANATNYKLFSELEAICKPGGNAAINNNQTGTIDHQMNIIPTSDTSTGEEASLNKERRQRRRTTVTATKKKKKKRKKKQLRSIASFFETMVKQFMDCQESLHHRFLQVLEKRDEERIAMDEAWRQQEAMKHRQDAMEREERQAVATARESVIVNFIENITGESLNLPTKAREDSSNSNSDGGGQRAGTGTNRWPKAEVQGLIEVRSVLEPRFQEPGLKGPLWEEVSWAMTAMGFPRDAKRCKEKWENINKYFRKAQDSTKKRPHYSKICPYFHLLDRLYSKTQPIAAASMDLTGNSELLDAIVVSNDQIRSHVFQHAPELNNSDHDRDPSAGTTVPKTTCKQKYDDDKEEGESLSNAPTTKAQLHEQDRLINLF